MTLGELLTTLADRAADGGRSASSASDANLSWLEERLSHGFTVESAVYLATGLGPLRDPCLLVAVEKGDG